MNVGEKKPSRGRPKTFDRDHVAADQPFETALEALTTYILRDHQEFGMPNGCLFVDLCQGRAHLEEFTGGQVDELRELTIETYAKWIDRAKVNGQFNPEIPTQTAALYIEAQIACIMNMQRDGVAAHEANAVFRLALSTLGTTLLIRSG